MANKGTAYKLTLLERIMDPQGQTIRTIEPVVESTINVPANVWEDIHDGMRRVIQTHRQFDNVNLEVSGKTGTAQTILTEPDTGVFVGFAPSYDPEYAIAVRIPNGYTSGNACLIAADIVQYIFNLRDVNEIVTGYASTDTSDVSND